LQNGPAVIILDFAPVMDAAKLFILQLLQLLSSVSCLLSPVSR
jgi:hypothetical protein